MTEGEAEEEEEWAKRSLSTVNLWDEREEGFDLEEGFEEEREGASLSSSSAKLRSFGVWLIGFLDLVAAAMEVVGFDEDLELVVVVVVEGPLLVLESSSSLSSSSPARRRKFLVLLLMAEERERQKSLNEWETKILRMAFRRLVGGSWTGVGSNSRPMTHLVCLFWAS